MTRFLSFLLCACFAMALSLPAEARPRMAKSDMFEDAHISTYSRPAVPSDSARGSDMFHEVPPLLNANADVFDSMRSGFRHIDPEMLHPRPMAMDFPLLFRDPD